MNSIGCQATSMVARGASRASVLDRLAPRFADRHQQPDSLNECANVVCGAPGLQLPQLRNPATAIRPAIAIMTMTPRPILPSRFIEHRTSGVVVSCARNHNRDTAAGQTIQPNKCAATTIERTSAATSEQLFGAPTKPPCIVSGTFFVPPPNRHSRTSAPSAARSARCGRSSRSCGSLKRKAAQSAVPSIRSTASASHRPVPCTWSSAACLRLKVTDLPRGGAAAARLAHNQKVGGSSPLPATRCRANARVDAVAWRPFGVATNRTGQPSGRNRCSAERASRLATGRTVAPGRDGKTPALIFSFSGRP